MTKPRQTETPVPLPPGVSVFPQFLAPSEQLELVESLRAVMARAPLMRPVTPWGKPMSVRMTSAGRVGWIIDRGSYRYSGVHPQTGHPWPRIPGQILEIWREVSGWLAEPDCCLINWYGEGARMGLHRDADEGEFKAPVVSISLGDPARFRIGGTERKGPSQSFILGSGDVLVMGGASRLAYHGVDRIYFGDGDLLAAGGRINLTLRVVKSA